MKSGLFYLKSSSTAWGNVWKLLFLLICVLSRNAILPNICAEESSQIKSASLASQMLGRRRRRRPWDKQGGTGHHEWKGTVAGTGTRRSRGWWGTSSYLHADDGVYKEQHHYKQGYIGQCLKERGRERVRKRLGVRRRLWFGIQWLKTSWKTLLSLSAKDLMWY